MGCVYLATNKINGKQYVGRTKNDLTFRKYEHKASSSEPLYPFTKAINKYGFENFEWIEVYSDISDESLLNQLEIECILWFNTKVPNGYNLTDGGDGVLNFKHSEESKKRMSEAAKRRIQPEETKNKIRNTLKGRKHSPERIAKTSAAMKGVPKSEEGKKNMSAAMKGRVVSEETREKIRQSNLGKIMSKEAVEKVRQANLGKKHTAETLKKMSESHKGNTNMLGKKHSDESKKKMSVSAKKRKATEEAKIAMSKAQKARRERERKLKEEQKNVDGDDSTE